MGSEFWEEKADTRLNLSNGSYVSINQILKAHINEQAFNDLVMQNHIVDASRSKHDRIVKEKIKGTLRTSGLSGERRFKKSAEAKRYVSAPTIAAAQTTSHSKGNTEKADIDGKKKNALKKMRKSAVTVQAAAQFKAGLGAKKAKVRKKKEK